MYPAGRRGGGKFVTTLGFAGTASIFDTKSQDIVDACCKIFGG